MAHISRGSGTPAGDTGWRLVEASGPGISYGGEPPDRLRAWFASDQHEGVRVAVTVRTDGTLLSFEVHNEGVEAAHSRAGRALGGVPPELAGVTISRRLVRSIPISDLVRAARARALDLVDGLAETVDSEDVAAQLAGHAGALRSDTKRPGRRGRPDVYYAHLALAYEAWQRTGRPLDHLAREVGLSPGGLRAALNTARVKKGMLTAAPPGRAGGVATEKARMLVDGIGR